MRARTGLFGLALGLALLALASSALAQVPPAAPRPPPDGLRMLMSTPWRQILLALCVVFGVWFAYLARNVIFALLAGAANLLFRRADGRALAWCALLCLLGPAAWGIVAVLRKSSPDVQYFAATAAQLVLVILIVLLVVAFITWLTMLLFQLLARTLMNRRYELFVGWHFLRSHREERHQPHAYEGGHKPPALLLVAAGILVGALAFFLDQIPWQRAVGAPLTVVVPALRAGLFVLAVLLLTWPVRSTQRPGTVGLLEQAQAWLKNLPSILAVTPTTFISIVGVGVGVWALVVVLSVMAGFENDLRSKILATNPHVVIQDQEPMEGIPDVHRLLASLREVRGVQAAIPYVQGEVIITSRENRNVALGLRGIDPATLQASDHHLLSNLVTGSLDNLLAPERVVPSARWDLDHGARRAEDLPADREDGGEPAGILLPPGPGAEPSPLPESEDDEDIEPTPIPGTTGAQAPIDEGLRPGILLGRELAQSLRVGAGAEVTVVSPRDDAGFLGIQPRARTFRVAGIFHTGMYEFDLKLAYVHMSEAQRFFHMGSDINRIELRLDDPDDSSRVVASAQTLLARPSLEVLDWKALNRNLFSALQLEKIVMFVVLGFIVLVASFNIIGSLIMIILDKAQEIAILKSMGATRGAVRRMFLVLGGLIGLIGASAGLAVGWLTCWMIRYIGIQLPRQYYIDLLPVHVVPSTILAVFAAGIAVCLLATLYPAGAAARLRPVEGLHYD